MQRSEKHKLYHTPPTLSLCVSAIRGPECSEYVPVSDIHVSFSNYVNVQGFHILGLENDIFIKQLHQNTFEFLKHF